MDTYVTGVEDTSGEVVVKVPPKPKAGEVPRGLEDVATYLYTVSGGFSPLLLCRACFLFARAIDCLRWSWLVGCRVVYLFSVGSIAYCLG